MSGPSAREEILGRIREANANAGVAHRPPREQHPLAAGLDESPVSHEDMVTMFAERVEDYRAVVEQCPPAEVANRVAAAVANAHGVIVPDGFPTDWRADVPDENVREDPGTPHELDTIEAVVTTSAAGIARTGTIVLDHTAGQGRRALTLVPDLHVCIVRAGDVHLDVPEAVAVLREPVEAGHPLTWISGPSATSDIELSRVEGVHGPRRLHVIVVTGT